MTYKKMLFILLFIFIAMFPIQTKEGNTFAFSPQVIQHGAVGDDVIELQARLKHIGFYTGEITGVFDWRTYWALRHFQYEFGMEIDGMAGKKTKEMLEKSTDYDEQKVKAEMYGTKKQSSSPDQGEQGKAQQDKQEEKKDEQADRNDQQTSVVNIPQGFSQNDIQLMANAVHGEARGEPYEGQVAVAAVILNRTKSPTFPNTVSGVIFEPRAFTAVADGQIWLTPNETARRAVLDAINGWDPTGNAIYYFNPDTATSPWIWTRPQIKRIGKHIFCH
ncbi:MAG TPA: spore cortex-lytic enzyme [Pseudogracilibacillus sp.]|nr:spore cortex-lytic enzyme [Pseudogracilibacillus sp.]